MPAHGAAGPAPLLKAVAVEDVLAWDGQEARGVVHALEAHGAGGQLDEAGRGRWERLGEAGGRGREGVVRELREADVRLGRRLEGDGLDEDDMARLGLEVLAEFSS